MLWLCFLDEPPSQSFRLLEGGGIQARLPTYKKVCVNLARERMIVDLSTGFLVWLLVRPRSTRRVTLGAPCSKPAVHLHLHLLVTPAALHLLLPAQARNHSYHSTATYPCSCLFVCVRCPPTHSFCLRWQIIVEYDTADADKCAVRLLQPFVFAYALFACGCFCPCVWLFSPT